MRLQGNFWNNLDLKSRLLEGQPMKRFEIYLPLYYGDGTRIEEEKFELTRRELVEKFGGLTVLPVPPLAGLGFWVFERVLYRDVNQIFIVDAGDEMEQEAVEFFRKYKEKLKERFRQVEIYIVYYDIKVI